jgi:hypothetical protein
MQVQGIWIWMVVYCLGFSNAAPPSLNKLWQDNDNNWEISTAVHSILVKAHRGGSLVYRGECQPNSRMRDRYLVGAPLDGETLNEALDRITRLYPNITWIDFGPEEIRILDKSASVKLLNLRVSEFRINEAKTASMAVSAIWNLPEVQIYAKEHHITFVIYLLGVSPTQGLFTPISVHLKNATIAEIMDSISRAYHPKHDMGWHNVWSYHECEADGEMFVELQIM